jgi:lipoprotein-anchoring transpeptidase ErfK/SrfK
VLTIVATRPTVRLVSVILVLLTGVLLMGSASPFSAGAQRMPGVRDEVLYGKSYLDFEELVQLSGRQRRHRAVGYAPLPTVVPPTPTPVSSPALSPPAVRGKALVVDQSAQVLRVYEDGMEVRTIPVSTGVRRYYTPAFNGTVGHYAATFYSFGTFVDHAWYLTKAWGNIWIHGAPYTEVEGEKVYYDLEFLGVKPSSHGCIRVSPEDAVWLLDWRPQGVPIRVTPPDFALYTD